jgi:hypothetical protein
MGCCRVDYVRVTSVELAPGILWHRDELEVFNLPNVEACLVRGEALGLMDMTVCLLAPSLQLLAVEKGLQMIKEVLKVYFCTKSFRHLIVAFTELNPILYTAWLDNHTLTLKRNSAK